MMSTFQHWILHQHSQPDSFSDENFFGFLRFYLRENPSKWMGCFLIPALNPCSTRQQGLDSLNQLCGVLNEQLPHLYHYFQEVD